MSLPVRLSLAAVVLCAALTLPRVHAGLVWPAPASLKADTSRLDPLSSAFGFKAVGSNGPVLQAAFARYLALLSNTSDTSASSSLSGAALAQLQVDVKSDSEQLDFGVDESYTLEREASSSSALLTAPTVFGALRGLETFSQLADQHDTYTPGPNMVPASFSIQDKPRFAYRGLMMDYSRHYYPVSFIKHTIDAMVYSKLNVLHMHITDDQSFPIQSEKYPTLSEKGAYGPQYVYTKSDITDLGTYASERGVLLVPEFDMPSHSASWGAGEPDIIVSGSGCSNQPFTHGDTMDPTKNKTFEVVDGFLSEMAEIFPKPFLHLGGDEVPESCWGGSESVKQFMKEHNIADFGHLESYFVNRVASGEGLTKSNRTLVYWEEIFNNGVSLPKTAIIQAWKSNAMPGVVKLGHRVTNSFKWYLNHGCNNYGDGLWGDFYTNDPLHFLPGASTEEQKLVMGGETTMWGECVDAVIFDAIVWPRAAAAAEQLWSPQNMTKSADTSVAVRLAQHRCRLVHRGVTAAPINDSDLPRQLNPGCQ